MNNRRSRNEESSEDSPIYSRLFIVCERSVTEDQFRDAFSKFGTIEDIRLPRDHKTGEPRGVAYIKFLKTSEAARALQEMHHKNIGTSLRPLKVMVAANRSDIQSDDLDEDKFKRLFITVSRTVTENDICSDFDQFGHIESVLIQRDRQTDQPKGFAYVKYRKFSEAAIAIEECDKKYRAIFAMPKGHNSNRRTETFFESSIGKLASTSSDKSRFHLMTMMNTRPRGFTKVNFMCNPHLTQMHVESLFDIVPGMLRCQYGVDVYNDCGRGTVSYSNPISAAYAIEKLNHFEYPPGMKIFVKPDNSKFDPHEKNYTNIPKVTNKLKNAIQSVSKTSTPDLVQLTEAIAEASNLIKMATAGVSDENIPDSNDLSYCSVKLPPPKPLADIDSPVAKRCFLVCKPHPPPLTVLRDIFCRFGDLINVYTLPSKTVGYARYASEAAADEAMRTLHGAEICGVRMKVLEAEEEAPPKKRRMD